MANKKVRSTPIRLVVFTKDPVSEERVRAIKKIATSRHYIIVGVFVEDAIHLPLYMFIRRTFRRMRKGYIYAPEFISNMLGFFKRKTVNTSNVESELQTTGIPVIRVKNIQLITSLQKLRTLKPDLGLVIGHRIIPPSVFEIPKFGTLNVHHGILPRYAGSHTTFWRLVEGHKTVGVTIHKVSKNVDSGDILYIKEFAAKKNHLKYIYQHVLDIVPDAVYEALERFATDTLTFTPQKLGERKVWKPPTFWERRKYKKFLGK